MQKFFEKCSLGRREIISSVAVYAILLGSLVLIILTDGNNKPFIQTTVPLVLLSAAIAPLLLTPRAIEIRDDNIIIHRLFSRKTIPIQSIVVVGRRNRNDFGVDMRLAGGAGLMGYFGLFTNRQIGKYWAIANNSNELFWVISNDKIRLLSCNNSQECVRILNEMINKN